MESELSENVRKRNRRHSLSISNDLYKRVNRATRGVISNSSFIRVAIINELEKQERKQFVK